MKSYGQNIGYLHSTEIIHGDLTTSNAMVSDDKLFVIDFGLSYRSQRVEDKAVDIHLLKQVLNSSHPDVADEAWEKFVEGYSDYDRSDEVLQQLKDVEKRGRYK
jgi:Kae1-associated kinase Bud32